MPPPKVPDDKVTGQEINRSLRENAQRILEQKLD